MWLEGIVGFIAVEALVELWKKAAPLQGIKRSLVLYTPFLYSKEQDTHLLECGYCLSVWIAVMVMMALCLIPESIYVFGALAIHRLANYLHMIFSLIRDLQLDRRARRNKIYG